MAESYKFSHWGSTSETTLSSHFPLHRACRDGDIECLSALLIEAQHGIYVEDNFYGWTPAHWAAYFGKLACLRKLMQVTRVGADCDVKSSRFCQTPAHLAAFGGHPQSLLWLLQSGAGVDCQDYLGETPAHKAARTGSMECVSLLVSHGAKLFIQNISGLTPAQLAEKCGHLECAKYMESAAVSQQNDPRGVYQQHRTVPVQPSPADITVTEHYSSLVNGGAGHHCNGQGDASSIPTENALVENCEMEDDAMDASSQDMACPGSAISRLFAQPDGTTTNGFAHGDVTLDPAVSRNQAPIAGQKRHREEVEENTYKRQRTSDGPSPSNLSKPSDADVVVTMDTAGQPAPECSAHPSCSATTDSEPYQNILNVSCEPLQSAAPTNTYHNNNLTFLAPDPQHDIFGSLEVALDYDDQCSLEINGAVHFQDENVCPKQVMSHTQNQITEPDHRQMPAKCIGLGAVSNGFRTSDTDTCKFPFSSSLKDEAVRVTAHQEDTDSYMAQTNGHCRPASVHENAENSTVDHKTVSMVEHHEIVYMSQGYDSMCFESMYSHP